MYKKEKGGNIKLGADRLLFRNYVKQRMNGFLLDIAHAKVSSWHLEMDVFEYISGLPLRRLTEIHISGTKNDPGV